MAGGSSNSGSQIQSSEPWKPAQGKLKDVMGEAKNLYNKDKGFGVYGGDWFVGPSDDTNRALGGMAALAGKGNGLAGSQMDLSSALMSGNYNPNTSGYRGLLGDSRDLSAGTMGQLDQLSGLAGGQAADAQAIYKQLAARNAGDVGNAQGLYGDLYGQAGDAAGGAKQNYNSLFNQSGDYAGSARERFNSLYDQAGTDAASANARYGGLSGAYGDAAEQNIGDLQGLLGRSNDAAFNSALDTQIGKLGDDITRQFGGSSFGSAAHSGTLADQLGDVRTRAVANEFYNRSNLERGIQGDIAGQRTGALGAQTGLAGAMEGADRNSLGARQGLATGAYGIDSNLINTQSGLTGAGYGVDQSLMGQRQGLAGDSLNAGLAGGNFQAGMAGNDYNTGSNMINQQRGLFGDAFNVGQTGLNTQQGLYGAIENANQIGVQNRLAGQGIADQAYQSQYLPYERMAQVGATREGYDASKLQGQMDKYNAKQMAPLQRLDAYSGFVGGASNGYGTTTGTVSTPSNPWGSAAGGAMLGAQALGPLGALGGGLLGYLGG